MATESGFNPVPLLVHLVAIALGLYLGFIAMDAITPDLPGDDVAPGVSSSVAPGQVAGDDPDSLFVAANLGPALAEIDDQLAAGQGIVSLHIEPGTIDADTGTGDGLSTPTTSGLRSRCGSRAGSTPSGPGARRSPTSPSWIWSRPRRGRAGTSSSTSTATSDRRPGPTRRRSRARP